MIRRLPRLIICSILLIAALPTGAYADQVFRVTATVANVRERPTTSSPVIAKVTKGVVLDVLGQSGEWIKVTTISSDGIQRTGFISLSVGILDFKAAPRAIHTIDSTAAPPASGESAKADEVRTPQKSELASTTATPRDSEPAQPQPVRPAFPTASLAEGMGVGGRLGGFTFGLGLSGRYWSRGRFGFNVGLSRFSIGDDVQGLGKATVIQFAPAVTYKVGDFEDDDDVFIQPFVGGGINIYRSTLTYAEFIGGGSESATDFGFSVLGGVEGFFKSVPISLTADIGYYSTSVPFTGFSVGGLSFSGGVHWYFRGGTK